MEEYSICREERQYAVFLYNILRKYGKKQSRENLTGEEKNHIFEIFEACGIEADSDIEHVFYEATFMRDFFKRERRYSAITKYHGNPATVLLQQSYANEEKIKTDFNRRLIEYAYLRYNLGRNFPKGCKDLENKECGQRYLLFIECKFESSEAAYNNTSPDSGNQKTEKLRQCSVQYDVAKFLCDYCLNEKLSKSDPNAIHLSPIMESNKKSKIIKFIRTNKKTKNQNDEDESSDRKILIKTLIDYNNKIFEDNN